MLVDTVPFPSIQTTMFISHTWMSPMSTSSTLPIRTVHGSTQRSTPSKMWASTPPLVSVPTTMSIFHTMIVPMGPSSTLPIRAVHGLTQRSMPQQMLAGIPRLSSIQVMQCTFPTIDTAIRLALLGPTSSMPPMKLGHG